MRPRRGFHRGFRPGRRRGFSRALAGLALVLALLAPLAASAVLPDEVLDDPALESRARDLSQVIRCLVCQNESIDTSNAPLARELRLLVRERLTAGDSDQEVLDFLVARYGDFVLLRPPLSPRNYLLWFGPAALLLLGAGGVALYFRRRRPAAPAALSAEEQARIARLMTPERDAE
jgi:cytochrome c-type biogenesis protein CcmH